MSFAFLILTFILSLFAAIGRYKYPYDFIAYGAFAGASAYILIKEIGVMG